MFGLKRDVLTFFSPHLDCSDNRLAFNYGDSAVEYWRIERHIIPSTGYVWLAGTDFPNLVTQLYIGYSATDLICFMSQRHHLFMRCCGQSAWVALGLLPRPDQVSYLKTRFPLARWHLLFHHDLLGSIADTCIAAWSKNHSISFSATGDRLIVSFRNQRFHFDTAAFSLHRFELITGLRAGVRTHKPPHGFLSFTDLQVNSIR